MQHFLFLGFLSLAVLGLLLAAFSRRLIYALLGGSVTLFVVAWLLIFLGAETVGVAHLVIYVGGILVLFLFGLFFVRRNAVNPELLNKSRALVLPLLATIGVAYFLWSKLPLDAFLAKVPKELTPASHPQELGKTLMTSGALGFELVAVLLLVALVGSGFYLRKRVG